MESIRARRDGPLPRRSSSRPSRRIFRETCSRRSTSLQQVLRQMLSQGRHDRRHHVHLRVRGPLRPGAVGASPPTEPQGAFHRVAGVLHAERCRRRHPRVQRRSGYTPTDTVQTLRGRHRSRPALLRRRASRGHCGGRRLVSRLTRARRWRGKCVRRSGSAAICTWSQGGRRLAHLDELAGFARRSVIAAGSETRLESAPSTTDAAGPTGHSQGAQRRTIVKTAILLYEGMTCLDG